MDGKEKKIKLPKDATAAGIDPDASYGVNATKSDIKKGESTKVTRLVYDEYDPSDNL